MRLLHIGLIVTDLERSAAFYEEILGLGRDPRPELGFDGVFYGLGGGQQIHLMRLDDPYQGIERPAHGGRDNHVALAVDDLEAIRARLDTAAIPYTKSRSGRAAIFCRDPDGHAVELCCV